MLMLMFMFMFVLRMCDVDTIRTIISQLALCGADPQLTYANQPTAVATAITHDSWDIVQHLLYIFHPYNNHITCHIPMTRSVEMVFYRKSGLSHEIKQLILIIDTVNYYVKIRDMRWLLLATHPRVGNQSTVFSCVSILLFI